jgi:hypothetical protein
MSVQTPPPPPLPEELDRLLRRLRLPYVRHAAPEVLATATSQRWEPRRSCASFSSRRPPDAFHTLEALAALIGRHRADQSIAKAIGRLPRRFDRG